MPELMIRPVPDNYLRMVKLVEDVAQTPVFLAGGAVRDTMHGVEVKDLDLFLSYSDAAWDMVLTTFSVHRRYQMLPPEMANYSSMVEVAAVVGYDVAGIPVNIIFLQEGVPSTLGDVIKRCDFGLCQIGCGSDGRLMFTEAFLLDAANKTFTNTRFGDEPRARNRYDRLVQKYPGYRLINEVEPINATDLS